MSVFSETDLPIPPLDPTHYIGWSGQVERFETVGLRAESDVIFKLRAQDYKKRMEAEALRLQRERHLEQQLAEKTQMIVRLTNQVKQLQANRWPSVAALRQAYMEDRINQQEFETLLLYVLGGES